MIRLVTLATLLLASTSAFAWGGNCAHSAKREVALDLAGVQRLAVQAKAGDLDIRGEAGLTRATAVGTACASSEELLAGIELLAVNEGGTPTFRVVTPELGWALGDQYAGLDLEVRVPVGTSLVVTDTSGDTEVENVAALDVADSSGDIEVRGVAGLVTVDDNSGDVTVRDSGAVTVTNDSSGDLEFSVIAGTVQIDNDSSGDIEIDQVGGDARIVTDSSGDIEFREVRGSAIVEHDSSGGIRADGVGGDFVVRVDGSGDVSHSKVAGRVDVPESD